jgi:hypothetical protein
MVALFFRFSCFSIKFALSGPFYSPRICLSGTLLRFVSGVALTPPAMSGLCTAFHTVVGSYVLWVLQTSLLNNIHTAMPILQNGKLV